MAGKMYFDTSSANNLDALAQQEPDESIATPSSVKDKYAYKDAVTRDVLVGTMTLNTAEKIKIDPKYDGHTNNRYIIPIGYHDGTGSVYVGDLSEYTPGTATAADVINTKTFWVNGKKVTGTLDIKQATQEADATASDIVSPRTAWVNGKKVTGTIPKLPRKDKNLLAGESYTFPYGLSAGTTVISAADLASQTVGNALSSQIIKGQIAWVNGQKIVGTFDIAQNTKEYLKTTNATQNQVLSGKNFYSSVYSEVRSGTMPDHSNDPERILRNGVTFTIPEGYYSGHTTIKVQSLKDATAGSATPDSLVADRTAWVNGQKIVGTVPIIDPTVVELGEGEIFDIAKGFHTGNGKVKAKTLSSETIGTATSDSILEGSSAWVNGQKIVGTMPDNGGSSVTIGPGESYEIKKGYHDGTGNVWVKPLSDYTQANATSPDILITKNAWVNGKKVDGTMPNNGAVSSTLLAGESYTVPKGYHDGYGIIRSKDLASQTIANADNTDILKNRTAWVNGQKVTGTLELTGSASIDDVLVGKTFYNIDAKTKRTGTLALTGNALSDDVVAGSTFYTTDPKKKQVGSLTLTGSAKNENVLADKTFYNTNPKSKVVGTMPNNGAVSATLAANESYKIPKGYHDGSGIITAKGLGGQTSGTASAGDIAKGSTAWVNGEKVVGTLELTGNATTDKVVSGVTFYSDNLKQKLIGTMYQAPDTMTSLYAGESYTIPAGYHTGKSIVSSVDLATQTRSNATDDDILISKSAWVNGKKVDGTMPNRSSTSFINLAAGTTVQIPKGYYSGYGNITTQTLADQTVSDAVSDNLLIDKTAWVNGTKITGTMPDNTGFGKDDVTAGSTIAIPKGYHDGNGKIVLKDLSSQTDGTAIAYNILITKTAWVNGKKVIGTMPNNMDWSELEIPAGVQITVPNGFHNGSGIISTQSLAEQTVSDATPSDILAPKTAWVNGNKITGNIPTYTTSKLRIVAGNDIILPAGYYANPIHIYSLYGDNVLDLTGTSAEYEAPTQSLLPNDDGYIDTNTDLVITADIIM